MGWLKPLSWTRSFKSNDTYVQGCNDPNNSTTPEGGADIPDSTKCGACKPGWTRTADPAMMCWKVGYRVINCKTGEVYYGPKGYYQDSTGEWVTTGSAYKSFGDQVDIQHGSRKKTENKINRPHPLISYKPTPGYSGATKGWHGKYVGREVSMIRSDGEPVFKYNNTKGYKTTLSSGGGSKNPDDLMETLKESCGGTMTWIPLTEEQAAKVAPLLTTTPAASSNGGTTTTDNTTSAIDVTVMNVPPGSDPTNQLALQNQTSDPVYGCMDPNATNYDATVTDDDGSCEYESGLNMGYVIGGVGVLVGVAMMMRSRGKK
jgi:hypothetical protein